MKLVTRVALAVGLLLAVPWRASPQSAQNVLLVVNSNSRASEEIGEYYAQKRKIPTGNVDAGVELRAGSGRTAGPHGCVRGGDRLSNGLHRG